MKREEEIFEQALALSSTEARKAYLLGVCGDDQDLRQRVDGLLAAHQDAGDLGFLKGRERTEDVPLSPSADRWTEQTGDRIGRYKLLQQIGEGGCGVVYMAEQEKPVRRRVALKVIKLGMDTKNVIARFEAERQALATMDHPNIAKFFDAGVTDTGRPYFVMELVRGVRITEHCDEARLSTAERLGLFIQVCQAIQHAHQKGVIHRDIKPSNILVTINDGVAVPKVIDFGIAKATEGRLTDKTLFTHFEALIGTPAYMSPEQAVMTSLDIDTRSDIYSLGVLLYEMLTGKTPFDAKELLASGVDAMRKTIREQEPVRPSTRLATLRGDELTTAARRRSADTAKLLHQLKGDLDWIVMKCLEKDRARRYETANGLAADIRRHLANEPVVARPPSAAYRFQKMVRRNKLAFAAVSVVTLTLIVGLGFSIWAFLREAAQRQTAVREQAKALRAQAAERQEHLRADAEKLSAQRHLYVANMNLAQLAWEQNNITRLRQLLEETREFPGRGYEWYYWQRQTHLALKTFRGHLEGITSVAFSPDGQRMVSGSYDRTAKVWEAASGRELLTLKGHDAGIRSVAISPDGQRMVTGSHDNTAKVWDAVSGRELLTLKGHGAQLYSVAYSPDSLRIVTGSGDNTAKLWEAASGRELLTLSGHSALIWSVAFSPDGKRVVTGSYDQTAKVWDAASGRELLSFRRHGNPILSAAFSPDGQRIVTGSADQTAKVWVAASGQELLTLTGHSNVVRSVAFSPDGRRIVTGSLDGTAKVWDAASGRELLTLQGHSETVYSVTFSPDGRRIATGSRDQTAKLWEAASALSSDKADNEILTVDGHSAAVYSLVFSPNGERIVTGSLDSTAKVWDAASRRDLLTLKGHNLGILSVAISRDGQRIVTGSWDQTAKVWDAATGQTLLTLTGHRASIWTVAFSSDGQRIVTGSYDQTAKVWDAVSGRELLTLQGHRARIWSTAFSPDGQRIVTGSGDQTAKMWDADSGREQLSLTGHSGLIKSLAFSPDGQRIVTGSYDQTAKVWDAATGRELLTLTGHGHQVRSVAFSPDGQRIVTGSADQRIKVWEAVTGRELLTLSGHMGSIWSAAFSPDGQWIAAGSDDQKVRVWQAARAEQVAAWQEEERAAAQHLTVLQRESTIEQAPERLARARDEGAIKQWLVLAPIPIATAQNGADALDVEQIEREHRLRPRAGEGASIANVELKWQEVEQEDYVIDFNVILGDLTQRSVAYAVCYIRSGVEQRGLRMLVGSDDEAKVYLNGKLIHKYPIGRGFVADRDALPDVSLNAGLNVLVFKVVNEFVDWKGSIRFTDARGNPVTGIQVTLNPDVPD